MEHAEQEEDQEVSAGHGKRRANQGVHSPQEQEREDILHVVTVSPSAPFYVRIFSVVLDAAVSLRILWVSESLFTKPDLSSDDCYDVHFDDQENTIENKTGKSLVLQHDCLV